MTPTVSRQLRKIPVTPENLHSWTSSELIPLLAQMIQGQNYVARQQASLLSDASGTFQTIWTSEDLAANTAVRFDGNVIGYENGNLSAFTIVYIFYNTGAGVVPSGNAAPVNINAGGFNCQFIAVGNHVELQVQDGGNPTSFLAVIDALVVGGP